jgi:hypothetical protein
VSDQVPHPYKKQENSYFCILHSSYFWIVNWQTKDDAPDDSKHSPNLQTWHIYIFHMKACVSHKGINPVKSSNCFMHHHFEHSKFLPYDNTEY